MSATPAVLVSTVTIPITCPGQAGPEVHLWPFTVDTSWREGGERQPCLQKINARGPSWACPHLPGSLTEILLADRNSPPPHSLHPHSSLWVLGKACSGGGRGPWTAAAHPEKKTEDANYLHSPAQTFVRMSTTAKAGRASEGSKYHG